MTEIIPLTLAQARRYVADHHRHNEPPKMHRFSIGLARDGELIGVVIAGHPTARKLDNGRTLELVRLTTTGDRNACSRLYGAACRAAAAMGYRKVITYTLVSESGVSLRAAGFSAEAISHPPERGWETRPGMATARLRLFDEPKMPGGDKIRWAREFVA